MSSALNTYTASNKIATNIIDTLSATGMTIGMYVRLQLEALL